MVEVWIWTRAKRFGIVCPDNLELKFPVFKIYDSSQIVGEGSRIQGFERTRVCFIVTYQFFIIFSIYAMFFLNLLSSPFSIKSKSPDSDIYISLTEFVWILPDFQLF